jgi:hypothetical protein
MVVPCTPTTAAPEVYNDAGTANYEDPSSDVFGVIA